MLQLFPLFLLTLCAGVLFSNAQPVEPTATEATFHIFAYGDNISGVPVVYADGKAEIGDVRLSTAKVAQPVYFTILKDSPQTWLAHPNTTEIRTASFTSKALALGLRAGAGSSSAGTVSFVETAQRSARSAGVLTVYGNYVLIGIEGANFYAERIGAEGVYSLVWSEGDNGGDSLGQGQGRIPLVLRTTAPATDVVL